MARQPPPLVLHIAFVVALIATAGRAEDDYTAYESYGLDGNVGFYEEGTYDSYSDTYDYSNGAPGGQLEGRLPRAPSGGSRLVRRKAQPTVGL